MFEPQSANSLRGVLNVTFHRRAKPDKELQRTDQALGHDRSKTCMFANPIVFAVVRRFPMRAWLVAEMRGRVHACIIC